MARSSFGNTTGDWLLKPFKLGTSTLVALRDGTTYLTFYSAKTGGTQYTDLLDPAGAATDRITVTGYQIPRFQGPDAIVGMWADKGDGSAREFMEAQDLAAAAAAVSAASASATAAAASAAAAAASVTSKEDKDALAYLAANHGVVGNGTTDDSTAFQSLLTAATSAGKRAMLAPGSIVKCVSAITVPSGCRLDLNGATLKNASASTTGRLLNLTTVSDVWIGNGTIDGDKAGFVTATEQRHNIRIVNSSRVIIENVLSKNAKGDGIYVGDDVTGLSTDITLINFRAEGNYRNGGSATAVKKFRQYGGYYRANGGTSPNAGFDVEPNTDAIECSDGTFYGVAFDENLGDGLLVQSHSATLTGRQSGWRFYGCTANGNGTGAISTFGHGIVLRWTTDFVWEGGEIRSNLLRGVYFRDTMSNIRFNTDVVSNQQEGYGQPAGTITGLRLRGLISGNGTSGTYDNVNLAGSGSQLEFQAASNSSTRYGLRTLSGWSSVTISSISSFTGNTTGTVSLGDTAASRTVYALGISGGIVPVGRSTTALRPTAASVSYGVWIDTTLKKIIWSDGTNWYDSAGTVV